MNSHECEYCTLRVFVTLRGGGAGDGVLLYYIYIGGFKLLNSFFFFFFWGGGGGGFIKMKINLPHSCHCISL